MLERYKEWVRRHPGIVQNLDWLLLLTVWNPSRTSGGSEATYEAYHAAVGLLSLWHQHIIEEKELPTSRPTPYLLLDALEYVSCACSWTTVPAPPFLKGAGRDERLLASVAEALGGKPQERASHGRGRATSPMHAIF